MINIKLADFGVSEPLERNYELTEIGRAPAALGTIAWTAPEFL